MIDPNAVAGYRRALDVRGRPLIVRRITGNPPGTVTTTNARVRGIVMDYMPKPPVSDQRPEGGITLGARKITVLACDLESMGFSLPVAKNDKVVLNMNPAQLGNGAAAGDEELNVMSVDPWTRGIAGAIDIVAEGV